MEEIKKILREQRVSSHQNQGIAVCTVADEAQGFGLVTEILYRIVDRRTALYLSGGRTPKNLYTQLAHAEKLRPGVVGLVDERFGPPMHENSNEKMLQDTGLSRYLSMTNIVFHPMLAYGMTRQDAALSYDQKLRELHAQYQKHIAILGVGLDGHTAGLPALNSKLKTQNSNPAWFEDLHKRSKDQLVIDYDDKGGFYGERVTQTFLGLTMMDVMLVLVFGKDKLNALQEMFREGSEPFGSAQGEEEIPSRFFKRTDIAPKTLLITDLHL